jgi:lipopolysaccharide biosynthesis glycosyltransferase
MNCPSWCSDNSLCFLDIHMFVHKLAAEQSHQLSTRTSGIPEFVGLDVVSVADSPFLSSAQTDMFSRLLHAKYTNILRVFFTPNQPQVC